jgi:hypothetical protein
MPLLNQVTLPAQDRVRAYQQPEPTHHLRRKAVQQRRELMAKGQNLGVLVSVAHR